MSLAARAQATLYDLPLPAVRRAQTLANSGLLRQPRLLIAQWRHRRQTARLMRALFYARFADAVLLAVESGLLRQLVESPGTAEHLARAMRQRRRPTEALLRILEAQHLARRRDGVWSATAFTRDMLVGDGPLSLRPTLELLAAQSYGFPEVVSGMRTGKRPKATDIFTPRSRYHAFLDAVNGYLHFAARDLLARIELPRVQDAIVGSMGVSFSAALLERQPQARVTYGCLDHLVREIPALIERYEVPRDRVVDIHAHGGDPELDAWGGEAFDLVFLTKKMILEPEQHMGEKFARKALRVLRPGGAAIFWETLYRDDGPTPLPRALEGLLDLRASPDGLVQTERSITTMLRDMGYDRVDVVPVLMGQTTFVVARRG